MNTEKKIFATLYPLKKDIKAKWFIKFRIGTKGTFKKYIGKINDYDTIEEREAYYKEIVIKWQEDGKKQERTPFKEVWEHFYFYIEDKKYQYRHKTYLSYHSIVVLYTKWQQKNKDKKPINWISDLQKQRISNRTIHARISLIKSLYNQAVKNKIIKENPLAEYKKISYSSRSKMYFSDDQILNIKNHLLKSNEKGLWLACQLCYYCFIRPGELKGLKISDINIHTNKIEVRGEISKNKKTQKVTIPTPLIKDIIPLTKEAPEKYLFGKNFIPDYYNNGSKYMQEHFKKVLKKLGITGNFSFYSWKHTGAVKAVKAGINLKEIQIQLRHHSLDMTNEYLKNLGVFDLEQVEQRFPEI